MFTNFDQVNQYFKERANIGIKPGLKRMKKLLQACGNPEQKTRCVHVAGTNGKGSTIQYIKDALIKNGFDVGVFSSPSLQGIRGHITINHNLIPENEFILLLNELYPKIVQLDKINQHPTEFEIITVIAFMYFEKNCNITLIEAGMGGRNDTTNCIIPLLSIITSIAFDHMQFLGETIEEIAYEKAGIIKQNRPVIVGVIGREGIAQIRKAANSLSSSVYELDSDFTYLEEGRTVEQQQFIWSCKSLQYNISIRQKGIHQIKNCSLAIMAIVMLKKMGLKISIELAIKAFEETYIPGRFEQICNHPSIIVDGAHNIAGIKAFLDTIKTHYYDVDKTLIFSAFRDKEIKQMLILLEPYFSKIILTSFDHPRAATTQELSTYTKDIQKISIMDSSEFKKFCHNISVNLKNDHYFITGSLFFIKIIKEYFEINRKL